MSKLEYKPPARMNLGRKINMGYQKMLETILNAGLEGCTNAMIASELNISKSYLYELQQSDQNVSDAIDLARTHSQAFLEAKARDNLESQYFQSSVWNKLITSRFPEDYHENFTLNVRNLPQIEDNIVTINHEQKSADQKNLICQEENLVEREKVLADQEKTSLNTSEQENASLNTSKYAPQGSEKT